MIRFYNRNLKVISQKLRNNMTEAEQRLWRHLKGKGMDGYPFNRQKIIGKYIVDFYCAKASLVIEVDGGQHYSEEGIEKDETRDQRLMAMGLRVIRFTDHDVFANIEGVLRMIWERIHR